MSKGSIARAAFDAEDYPGALQQLLEVWKTTPAIALAKAEPRAALDQTIAAQTRLETPTITHRSW